MRTLHKFYPLLCLQQKHLTNYFLYFFPKSLTCPLNASMINCKDWGCTHSMHFWTTWLPFWSFTHFRTWPSSSRTISFYWRQGKKAPPESQRANTWTINGLLTKQKALGRESMIMKVGQLGCGTMTTWQ